MTTAQLLAKISSVKLIFDPSWVDGCPGCPGPVFHDAIGDYVIAGLLKQVAGKLQIRDISDKLISIARSMAEQSARGLVNGWEDGDDICPPWWPHRFPKPQPDPWDLGNQYNPAAIDVAKFSPAMRELMLAGAIKQLASLTTNADFSKAIFAAGQSVVRTASAHVFDEYCGTVPKPRPHVNIKREVFASLQ